MSMLTKGLGLAIGRAWQGTLPGGGATVYIGSTPATQSCLHPSGGESIQIKSKRNMKICTALQSGSVAITLTHVLCPLRILPSLTGLSDRTTGSLYQEVKGSSEVDLGE